MDEWDRFADAHGRLTPPATEDDGGDLRPGQTVWIKAQVKAVEVLGGHANVKVQYMPRPFHDEFAEPWVAAIFLWRKEDLELCKADEG